MNSLDERYLVRLLHLNAWVVWLVILAATAVLGSSRMFLGALFGGFLVVGNLYLLRRQVNRALDLGAEITPKQVLPKFYLCFLITVIVIVVLMVSGTVDGFSLLLGLSVFVWSLFSVVAQLAGRILYKMIFKEAV